MTAEVSTMLARLEALEGEVIGLRRQLVANLGRTDLGEQELSVLECRAAQQRFGLMLSSIDMVVPVARLMPLPEAPSWILGSLNLHGTSVVVLDVVHRLTDVPHVIAPSELIVICAAEWRQVGLLVDEVLDVLTLDATGVKDPAPGVHFAPFLAGVIHQETGSLPLLEVSRLAAASVGSTGEG